MRAWLAIAVALVALEVASAYGVVQAYTAALNAIYAPVIEALTRH